jgi:hypothetical protein
VAVRLSGVLVGFVRERVGLFGMVVGDVVLTLLMVRGSQAMGPRGVLVVLCGFHVCDVFHDVDPLSSGSRLPAHLRLKTALCVLPGNKLMQQRWHFQFASAVRVDIKTNWHGVPLLQVS